MAFSHTCLFQTTDHETECFFSTAVAPCLLMPSLCDGNMLPDVTHSPGTRPCFPSQYLLCCKHRASFLHETCCFVLTVFADERTGAPRSSSSCTLKRITSTRRSVFWVQHLPRKCLERRSSSSQEKHALLETSICWTQ